MLKFSEDLEDFKLFNKDERVPEEKSALSEGSDRAEQKSSYANSDYSGRPAYYFIYAKDCEYVSITGFAGKHK